jgi:benzoyl-CoA 2,3-dioxygenase component B
MIPNNIDLDSKPKLKSALEAYQCRFKKWWIERGPFEFLEVPMKIRCPKAVGNNDWAEYKTVSLSEYKWGIFTVPREQSFIKFGAHQNEKVWNTVPSDYFPLLLDHVVKQADAENGAVEQARVLTKMAPSFYDLNNLFQFLLEEGRHSWAMVHVLLEHFGHDGLIEANKLLERMSGDSNSPRLLDAFNAAVSDWLSHFIWCFLSDRTGKYQLGAITQGAFSPLAESARFMMCEEPLHIKMGTLGLERVLHKSVQITIKHDRDDIFQYGAIPLPVIQKYLNYWTPSMYDLFGHDESNRAYNMYQMGVRIANNFEQYKGNKVKIDRCKNNKFSTTHIDPERAINCIMRQQFISEVQRILDVWNNIFKRMSVDFSLKIPHERFNRKTGPCRDLDFDIHGELFSGDDYQAYFREQIPTPEEFLSVSMLMKRTLDPEKYASWISPSMIRLGDLL